MERIREGDILVLVDPLRGIAWVREQLVKEYGSNLDQWPESVQDFFRFVADETVRASCGPPLECIDVGEQGTISTGKTVRSTTAYFSEYIREFGVVPLVGHLPEECYIELK